MKNLTAREREVINLVAMGRTNKEIAPVLGISPNTVKCHLERIYRKTGAKNRAEVVVGVLPQVPRRSIEMTFQVATSLLADGEEAQELFGLNFRLKVDDEFMGKLDIEKFLDKVREGIEEGLASARRAKMETK